jgi:hypothetical protein
MNTVRTRTLPGIVAVAVLLLGFATMVAEAEPAEVRIEKHGDGYRMLRDGKPYFIRGAGGSEKLDVLAASGGNSIRTWSADRAVLDRAQQHGLTVMMGLRVGLPRHGFNYRDPQAVARQLEETRKTVEKLKDHPALLLWGLGNEVELGVKPEDRALVWKALEDLARMVKRTDGRHPVVVVLAGLGGGKLAELNQYCPSMDALGVNAYGSMLTAPETLRKEGWQRPYVATEFGPRGHWEVEKTPWGLPIEDNSTQKAEFYLKAYQHTVSGQANCLGSYVFLWGQKQEKTHTWYGMFLPEGNRTASVDALSYAWTGQWPADRCPRIGAGAIRLEMEAGSAAEASGVFAPGAALRASFDVADPEGKPLTIRWDLRKDVSDNPSTGGDREDSTPPVGGVVSGATANEATLRLPKSPGNYRIFAYATDPAGNAATANVPIQVK